MKKLLFLLGMAMLLGAAKCKQDADLLFNVGDTFKVKVGEMAGCACKEVAIQFVGVTEDSRCPKNTNCVWAGEIKTSMMINGNTHEMKLGADEKGSAKIEAGNYTVQLLEVNPYPEAGQKIEPESYVAKMIVEAK